MKYLFMILCILSVQEFSSLKAQLPEELDSTYLGNIKSTGRFTHENKKYAVWTVGPDGEKLGVFGNADLLPEVSIDDKAECVFYTERVLLHTVLHVPEGDEKSIGDALNRFARRDQSLPVSCAVESAQPLRVPEIADWFNGPTVQVGEHTETGRLEISGYQWRNAADAALSRFLLVHIGPGYFNDSSFEELKEAAASVYRFTK